MIIESTPFQCSRELSETFLCLFKVLFPVCFAMFSTIIREIIRVHTGNYYWLFIAAVYVLTM